MPDSKIKNKFNILFLSQHESKEEFDEFKDINDQFF